MYKNSEAANPRYHADSITAWNEFSGKFGAHDLPPHFVQFYENDDYLNDAVTFYVKTGLDHGEAAIVIATAEHRVTFAKSLGEQGVAVDAACAAGQLTFLDAHETLVRLMSRGYPDAQKFAQVIGAAVRAAAARYPRVRAYGEMVDILWKHDNLAATVELERLWCDLCAAAPLTLLCGYALTGFHRAGREQEFRQVCDAHSHVFLSETVVSIDRKDRNGDDRSRAIKLLEQRSKAATAALEREQAARAQIEAQKQQVEQALRTRDEFLSIASHELKTPLASLKIQLQLVLRRFGSGAAPASDELQQRLQASVAQIDRMAALIDQLLSVSRIQAGKLALQRSDVDLSALAQDMVDQYRDVFDNARCRVHCVLDRSVIGCWDRAALEQVLANLYSNAAKYAPGSDVEIAVGRAGERALFSVRDRGPGIARDKQAAIFEQFERAAPAHVGGLGLGLFIARKIVTAHHGSIRVESAPGEGATFVVELPGLIPRCA